jgi:dihydroorotate dehydrogenase
VVETNFSCPNVATCDGQLYQQPADAARVAARIRTAIGRTPFVVKIGHVTGEREAQTLLDALAPHVDGLAMTNSVAATIEGSDGQLLFDGQKRGICGDATRGASLRQTAEFARLRDRMGLRLSLVGVGGASTAAHVRQYLDAGAEQVHLATAVMIDPGVGLAIRAGW